MDKSSSIPIRIITTVLWLLYHFASVPFRPIFVVSFALYPRQQPRSARLSTEEGDDDDGTIPIPVLVPCPPHEVDEPTVSFVVPIDRNFNDTMEQITFPVETSTTIIHQYFMQRALYQAQRASTIYSEVPIGAIIVRNSTTTPIPTTTTKTDIQSSESSSLVPPPPPHQQQQQKYEILSEQHNRVEMDFDASAHAELLALRDAAYRNQNWRLNRNNNNDNNNMTTTTTTSQSEILLYCTLEPCIMCYAAAHSFRIQQVIYGAPDVRLGACGSYLNMIDIMSVSPHPFHTITQISSGIYANESSTLLRNFFQQQRRRRQGKQTKSSSQQRRQLPLSKRRQNQSSTTTTKITTSNSVKWYRRLWKQFVSRFRWSSR